MGGCGSFTGRTFRVEDCTEKLPYVCQILGGGDKVHIGSKEEIADVVKEAEKIPSV
jgi:hypothetical protein